MSLPGRRAPARGRLRLVEGVVIAAAALLVLKAASLGLAVFDPDPAPDGLPAFAHVLSYARSNAVPDPSTTGSVPAPKEQPGQKPAEPPPARPTPVAKEAPPGSPSEKAIMERLGERREELQRRSRDIETREQLLEEAERRLEQKAGEIKGQAGAGGGPDAPSAQVKALVTMYETMKPKEAARVFERLPQDVLVPVVRAFNPRKMAEILAAMSPESAEKLTVALARPTRVAEDRPAAGALPPGELPALETPAPRPAGPKP